MVYNLRKRVVLKRPSLRNIQRITAGDITTSVVRSHVNSVSKYYENRSSRRLARYWLRKTKGYDLNNPGHLELLRWVFGTVELTDRRSIDYLHSMDIGTVRSLGLQRVAVPNRMFYRRAPGERV